jgi:hypothetical protein
MFQVNKTWYEHQDISGQNNLVRSSRYFRPKQLGTNIKMFQAKTTWYEHQDISGQKKLVRRSRYFRPKQLGMNIKMFQAKTTWYEHQDVSGQNNLVRTSRCFRSKQLGTNIKMFQAKTTWYEHQVVSGQHNLTVLSLRPGFNTGLVHIKFVSDKVSKRRPFLPLLCYARQYQSIRTPYPYLIQLISTKFSLSK